jgi:aminomethyltransferase
MPLYGHELSEAINPIQAGLGFAVDLQERDFLGRSAIAIASQKTDHPVRVGLTLAGRRVPREHCSVQTAGEAAQVVGEVTSGTFSPTANQPIAMAYVHRDNAKIGTQLAVDIRGKSEPATVVRLPFYKRKK